MRVRKIEKSKDPKKTAKRLMSYIFKDYKLHIAIVLICIVAASLCSVAGSMFLKTLIDSYIQPLLLDPAPDFGGLLRALSVMATIFATGIFCLWLHSFIMVGVAQNVLKNIRNDMFAHMQTLPIKYFD
ncbi:MAG: ABC transporter ATP-binding protein, partial [Clostridia bacterium]|nr:ABC transporter ATP-binding protein [Clostridia bacterium]